MNIIVSAYTIDPLGGSEKKNAWDWVCSALSGEHHVTLVTTPECADLVAQTIDREPRPKLTVFPLVKPRVSHVFGSELGMYLQYFKWQRSIKPLMSKLVDERFDLGIHTSWGNVLLGEGLTSFNIPVIIYPSGGGNFTLKGTSAFFGNKILQSYIDSILRKLLMYRPASRASLKASKLVLVENRQTELMARHMGAENVTVDFAATVKSEEIVSSRAFPTQQNFLWVGRLRPRKGALLALMAFRRLLLESPNSHLSIVGDGPMIGQLRQYAADQEIEEKVTFTGAIPFQSVQNLYLENSFFVFSSLRDSTGSQVLEAAAKGLPIITLRGLGIEQWIANGSALFADPGSFKTTSGWVNALATEMAKATQLTPAEWNQMSQSAISFALGHTFEEKESKIKQFIDSAGDNVMPG
jgi:glycosyltransferase involved in cell wall biosynthesis